MRNLPHYAFAHNQTWLEISLIAQDLLGWTRLICLTGELARAEPKRLRQRLLHIAGTRPSRPTDPAQTRPRLAMGHTLAAAFPRLRATPRSAEHRPRQRHAT